jgi:hypothetical protein
MNTRESIERNHRRMVTLAMAVAWGGPAILFLYIFWHTNERVLAFGCLLAMTLSIGAAALPEWWFRPRRWEQSGAIYEALGIRWFKRFMVGGDLVNRRIRQTEPDWHIYTRTAALPNLVAQTKAAEKGHLIWLLSAVPAVVLAAFTGWHVYAVGFTAINVVVNVYPILFQRYNRARLVAIASKRMR